MPEVSAQPLLTIAIPTYNRSRYLRELLEELLPQLQSLQDAGDGDAVELLISDNAATDDTPTVTAWAENSGVPVRVLRQATNIGPDRNFVVCFEQARGKYFYLLGDDDIIRPGGVARMVGLLRRGDFDIVFLDPLAFYKDWKAEYAPDPKARPDAVVTRAQDIARIINVGITFISGYIVNRERLLTLGSEPPAAFVDTNLVQLSWTLPLLRYHRQSAVLWERFVMGRAMNSGGYNVADVFGERFQTVVARLLPDRHKIRAVFANFALRRWFPNTLLELQENANVPLETSGTEEKLRRLFAGNPRFWLYTWPILRLPLPAARVYLKGLNFLNKVTDRLQKPSFKPLV
jgi:glycosyltransferase involved in cell wall biosynthesis